MIPTDFKDHFSGHAADYSSYRPTYPGELYSYLASICKEHRLAWDCATGTGQAAIGLAAHFAEVVATDASQQQVANASGAGNVTYRVARAEQSGLELASVDLVTVAQAIHWFDLEAFKVEVDRVLKPGGILAVWLYGLLTINEGVDRVVNHLYGSVLEEFWPPERQLIEEGYQHVRFSYEKITTPEFAMTTEWDMSQLIGYLDTWSAVKKYLKKNGTNPLDKVIPELTAAWGDETKVRGTYWPLTVLVWRKPV